MALPRTHFQKPSGKTQPIRRCVHSEPAQGRSQIDHQALDSEAGWRQLPQLRRDQATRKAKRTRVWRRRVRRLAASVLGTARKRSLSRKIINKKPHEAKIEAGEREKQLTSMQPSCCPTPHKRLLGARFFVTLHRIHALVGETHPDVIAEARLRMLLVTVVTARPQSGRDHKAILHRKGKKAFCREAARLSPKSTFDLLYCNRGHVIGPGIP